MIDDLSAERFERNLAAFADAVPELYAVLAAIDAPAARLVAQPGEPGDINLDLGGRLLYGGGARRLGAAEVDSYLASPGRITCTPPGDNGMVADVTELMRQAVAARGGAPATAPAAHRGAVLIMFGIGLGEPVGRLIDALPLRHVVILEPYVEILWHSLWVQDWANWLAEIDRRGGSFQLLVGEDARTMLETVFNHLRDRCFSTLDGLYLYRHYANATLQACWDGLLQRHAPLFSSKGFFEDELRMFENTAINIGRPVALIRRDARIGHDLPAVIVAAGPSLDASLADVARLREGCVLFTAGTTLSTLVRRDIEPDFHCEIENTPENFLALTSASTGRDLRGIRLIGSATVDPRIPPLFGDSLLFLRHNTLSAKVFGDNAQALEGTTPNCINLAARAAVHLGFRDIYLFGTDFGSRHPDRHHVSDSIWVTDPVWRMEYDRLVGPMSIGIPANFGGKAYTNRTLQDALWSLETLIARTARQVRFTNCSNGVAVAGAVRKAGAQVALPTRPAADKAAMIARIVDAAVGRHAGGALIDRPRIARFRDAYLAWAAMLSTDLAALRPGLHDLVDCADAIDRAFSALDGMAEGAAVRTLTEGSIMVMFQTAFHHAIGHDQVADARLLELAVTALTDSLARMRSGLEQTMAAIA